MIRIAAAVILRDDGRILLVRKRGTRAFMQPGGKIDAGESPAMALSRELGEELGLSVAPERLTWIARREAPAANEPGQFVDADVFLCPLLGDPAPQAEIEDMAWINIDDCDATLVAPLARGFVFDWLRARRAGASS